MVWCAYSRWTGSLMVLLVAVASCTVAGASGEKAGTFYVAPGGTGGGSSWGDAFGSIQDAVDAASGASGGEVWVAACTICPPRPR